MQAPSELVKSSRVSIVTALIALYLTCNPTSCTARDTSARESDGAAHVTVRLARPSAQGVRVTAHAHGGDVDENDFAGDDLLIIDLRHAWWKHRAQGVAPD